MPLAWKRGMLQESSGTRDHSCKVQPAGLPVCGARMGWKGDGKARPPPAVPHATLTAVSPDRRCTELIWDV